MLSRHRGRRSRAYAATRTAWMVTTCALLAGGAAAQVQVTSLQGAATAAGSPLSLHAAVGENLPVEVAHPGRCSLLWADRALLQLCGGARARFTGGRNGDLGSIELNAGELRAIAMAGPDDAPLQIHTPAASVLLRNAEAHVSAAPETGNTVVSALEGQVSVSRGDGPRAGAVVVNAGQQLTLRRDQAPGDPRAVSRESLARGRGSACPSASAPHSAYSAAVLAERAILATSVPAVGAPPEEAAGLPTSDLWQIVSSDFPSHGLPLDEPAIPSALITELSKTGLDEEVCDPITCNPVYRLEPPGPCGVPPQTGCIP